MRRAWSTFDHERVANFVQSLLKKKKKKEEEKRREREKKTLRSSGMVSRDID